MINIRYEETTVTHTIELIQSDNECFNIYVHNTAYFTPETSSNHFVYKEYIRNFYEIHPYNNQLNTHSRK